MFPKLGGHLGHCQPQTGLNAANFLEVEKKRKNWFHFQLEAARSVLLGVKLEPYGTSNLPYELSLLHLLNQSKTRNCNLAGIY